MFYGVMKKKLCVLIVSILGTLSLRHILKFCLTKRAADRWIRCPLKAKFRNPPAANATVGLLSKGE